MQSLIVCRKEVCKMFVIISKKRLRALQLEASDARHSALKWQRTAEAEQARHLRMKDDFEAHRNALRALEVREKTAMQALNLSRNTKANQK